MENWFNILLVSMSVLAVVVFFVLYFIKVGYGIFHTKKWGLSLPNRVGWIIMESPVFLLMALLWWASDRRIEIVPLIIFIFFEIHYFRRAFIFPFLFKTSSSMPLTIILSGVFFNIINAVMQGGWLFYMSPSDMYTLNWLSSWQFITGVIVFVAGMVINIQSDNIILSLRKPGDKNHYLPRKGMFKYVTSANYFGELVQWCGFAIMCWSVAGAVFVLWTFANLAPRADAINRKYIEMFPEQMAEYKPKRIIPFIY